ncbi:hypothetical protein CORT_0B03640 [Candida orthopsilosis Co 90-125]|uniref:Uncharacterized protein n=1 Tax=Candida orthopsilosis (strain 90-125) TaxID=1136231 RepID=H8X132_CANO9|nr:hypothetical protein CORT_0B03640 [Candida orthopsilosis Co 90-125]CCG22072.1 hypothetical protein CORT_0B03640 [Candida orthopsilosis Co 90-125]
MMLRSTTCQSLKRSLASQSRQFSQSCILTQPQFKLEQQPQPQSQPQLQQKGGQHSYLRYFQQKPKTGIDATIGTAAYVCQAGGSNGFESGYNSSRPNGEDGEEVEESWRYVDLVYPHVAEFADLF